MSQPYHAPELHPVDDQDIQTPAGHIARRLVGAHLPQMLVSRDIVLIDTTERNPKPGWVAVRIDGRELLGRFEPGLGRPKTGPLELWLGAVDNEGNEPRERFEVTPEFLEHHLIGHLSGHFVPHEPSQGECTAEEEAMVRAKAKEEQDACHEEVRRADEAAIKAKYRARPDARRSAAANVTVPDAADAQLNAPEGFYDLDAIVRKLVGQGRVFHLHLAGDPFASARSLVLSFANAALEMTRLRAETWPTQRQTAELIGDRIDELLGGMSAFLEHVRYEDAVCFISQEELGNDPSYHKEEAVSRAENRLSDAREAVQAASQKLKAFREPLQKGEYGHDGRSDILVNEFLSGMATAWELLTGELPGKTGNGLFVDFCVSGWNMAGWPLDGEAELRSRFAKRIERGVHLR